MSEIVDNIGTMDLVKGWNEGAFKLKRPGRPESCQKLTPVVSLLKHLTAIIFVTETRRGNKSESSHWGLFWAENTTWLWDSLLVSCTIGIVLVSCIFFDIWTGYHLQLEAGEAGPGDMKPGLFHHFQKSWTGTFKNRFLRPRISFFSYNLYVFMMLNTT